MTQRRHSEIRRANSEFREVTASREARCRLCNVALSHPAKAVFVTNYLNTDCRMCFCVDCVKHMCVYLRRTHNDNNRSTQVGTQD